MPFDGWMLTDEGVVDGRQYVTVLNDTFDPIEYDLAEQEASALYGLNLANNRYPPLGE